MRLLILAVPVYNFASLDHLTNSVQGWCVRIWRQQGWLELRRQVLRRRRAGGHLWNVSDDIPNLLFAIAYEKSASTPAKSKAG
jgi:hypothetical protein